MKFEILVGPPGCGKSNMMRDEALANPGLYLFAFPTNVLIDEQFEAFTKAAPGVPVIRIYSKNNRRATGERLHEARRQFEEKDNRSHAVILATHETIKNNSIEDFSSWHIRIDEAPNSVQSGSANIETSIQWLKDNFTLKPLDGFGWSNLTLRKSKPDWKAVSKDPGMKQFADAIKQADISDRFYINADDLDGIKSILWFTLWAPSIDIRARSLAIAGSGYSDSIGAQIEKKFASYTPPHVREIGSKRISQPEVDIQYFTSGHEGTTPFWDTSEGRLAIKKICDHLSRELGADSYWSGNPIVWKLMEHRLPGDLIGPLAAGLNSYRDRTSCAFIFSSKATENDSAILEFFGFSKRQLQASREDEAILQFVMRGAIRNQNYCGKYRIFLYSEQQAANLKTRLEAYGFNQITVSGIPEAGLLDVGRPKRGTEPSPEEQEASRKRRLEADRLYQQKKRAAKAIAAGREPGSKGGRPKKVK
jgi:hypothetical protein